MNSATSAFNQAATEHGIINDAALPQLEQELSLASTGKPHRGSPTRPGSPRRGMAQGTWVPSPGYISPPISASLYAGKFFRSL